MNREDLLEERKRILDELAAVDVLLKGRYGVRPSPPPPAPAAAPPPVVKKPETGNTQPETKLQPDGAIPYSELAREWVKTQTGQVTIKDFRSWLERRMANGEINNASLNAPMKKLVKSGLLTVIKEGSGRAPTVYSVESLRL